MLILYYYVLSYRLLILIPKNLWFQPRSLPIHSYLYLRSTICRDGSIGIGPAPPLRRMVHARSIEIHDDR